MPARRFRSDNRGSADMKLLIPKWRRPGSLPSIPDAMGACGAACTEPASGRRSRDVRKLTPLRCRRRQAADGVSEQPEISGTESRSSWRGGWRASGSALLLLPALAACAAYGGKSLQSVASEVTASATVTIGPPDAIIEPIGLRFHGWVCRTRLGIAPHALRVERIDPAGQVIDTVHGRVHVGPRLRACTTYDIPTDWSLGTGETLRICATGDGNACLPRAP